VAPDFDRGQGPEEHEAGDGLGDNAEQEPAVDGSGDRADREDDTEAVGMSETVTRSRRGVAQIGTCPEFSVSEVSSDRAPPHVEQLVGLVTACEH
jgi:hypothetical protein